MTTPIDIVSVSFDRAAWTIGVHANAAAIAAAGVVVAGLITARGWLGRMGLRSMEIDSAEFGLGNSKVTLKPNALDRQVAYELWVELATRKVGLPVDLKDDVISEIYNSWYSFFGVARDLVKSIPVAKLSDQSTRAIVHLSTDVLNVGMRPHLTQWQARFHHWYDAEVSKGGLEGCSAPQDIQARFPHFAELETDLKTVNQLLVAYRRKMAEVVHDGLEFSTTSK